ncbi:MAG: nodulation protein NfeD [Anaerolineae bacterium]
MFRKVGRLVYVLLILISLLSLAQNALAQEPQVYVLTVKGGINPAVASYVDRGLELAEGGGAVCLVIKLDTPGGLDSSMRAIIQGIINARVPVVVYVSPQGARAASAGAFITLAAHVAAMAPNTNIGAAHPVSLPLPGISPPEGGTDTTLMDKATNDAVAYIKSIAARKGRNVEWAEKAVRESASATEQEALELEVIDLTARDLDDLLAQLEGREVEVAGRTMTLHTTGAAVKPIPMTVVEGFLHAITDPNIAYILLILGLNGLIFELASPGGFIAGVVGSICLLLGLYALGVLSINLAGLLLILLAFVLFIADIKAPTHGALTAGGIISFVLGSLILFNTPFYAVSRGLIFSVAFATAAFFAFAVQAALRAQRRPVTTGREGLMGEIAVARSDLDPEGTVFLAGELWRAVAEGGKIAAGEKVRVVGIEGFELKVKKET